VIDVTDGDVSVEVADAMATQNIRSTAKINITAIAIIANY